MRCVIIIYRHNIDSAPNKLIEEVLCIVPHWKRIYLFILTRKHIVDINKII